MKGDKSPLESMYRFLLSDLVPFGKSSIVGIEHGGIDDSNEHYSSVVYWYGIPSPWLVLTDVLEIGNITSEKEHAYNSPDASTPYTITSRYEWGVDHIGNKTIFPTLTKTGRTTKRTSEFSMKIQKNNLGILIRRTLDYMLPNQRATVTVKSQDTKNTWQFVGIWFLAGSNSCIYSNPPLELDPIQNITQISNRRFRDDEFFVSGEFTANSELVDFQILFIPTEKGPINTAWSEIKYQVYSMIDLK